MQTAKPADPCARLELLDVKTARFAVIVEKCGAPEIYTLWQKPERDRQFGSLLRNNRVLTILRSPARTEFGVVGFCERKGASFLVFRKSLKRFIDKRIVGIKWDLVRK